MGQPALIYLLFFSFASFSQSLFVKSKFHKLERYAVQQPFLIAQSEEDEFDDDDLEDIEDVGERESPDDEKDFSVEEEEGMPPLESREDYEVIDEELEADLENGMDKKDDKKGRRAEDEMDKELEEELEREEPDEGQVQLDKPPKAEPKVKEDMEIDAEEDEIEAEADETLPPMEDMDAEDIVYEDDEDGKDMMAEDNQRDGLNLITNIRYISSEDTIVIDSSETVSYLPRKNTKNNQLIIEILQARLMDNLEWPYPLKDFKTKFGFIKADQKSDDTVRVVIQLKEGSSFPSIKSSEDGNQLIVGFGNSSGVLADGDEASDRIFRGKLPAKTLEDFYYSDLQFTGSPISFHVIDAPVKQVLQFISEESGLNMVIGNGVTGNITLKLEGVPWDQAFHIIVTEKNLGYRKQGNVIIVSTLQFMETRANKIREIAEKKLPLIPFKTEVISLSYVKPSDMKGKVQDFLTKENTKTKQEPGRVIVHEDTNTFIVMDTKRTIEKIKNIVKQLDRPPKQVMIEARIVEAVETFGKSFGFEWSLSGNLPVNISPAGFLDFIKGNFYGDYEFKNSGNISLNIGQIPLIGDISAALSLAEAEGYGRLVSSPKVVAISGKSASITRNSPLLFLTANPYQTAAPTPGGTAEAGAGVDPAAEGGAGQQVPGGVQTLDITLSLQVTPVVTSKGSVFLTVSVTRDSPTGSGAKSGEAFMVSRSAQTEVLVQNGHTVVIGRIYQYDETSSRDGIPFLSKIPFMSWLFDTVTSNYAKNELLVFLTPKVLDTNE